MKFVLYILLLLFAFVPPKPLQAQVSVWKEGKAKMENLKQKNNNLKDRFREWKDFIEKEAVTTDYNYALSLGARLSTNGWSGGIYFGKLKSAGKQVLWQLHFSEIKHEKEIKQEYTGSVFKHLGKSRPYAFGKINNVYILQLGYGRQQLLLPALINGNLSVSIRYDAGPALAFLKPYYLDLIYVDFHHSESAHIQTEKYNPGNVNKFLNPGYVHGAAKWSKGLREMKIIPGLFGELAFVLEPDKPKAFVKMLTFGGKAACYAQPLAIMAGQKAYRYQLSLFVGLAIGGRWK